VTLNTPDAGFWNASSEIYEAIFDCSITDDIDSVNISLYLTDNTNSSFAFNDSCDIATVNGSCLWYVNLSVGNYTWNCLGYDSNDQSDWGDANRTIKINWTNRVPTQGQPILNSSAGVDTLDENLTCYNQSTSDLDGDSVKNIFNWYLDSNPLMVLNMPFEGGSNSTYAKDYSGNGNDGTVDNATYNSTGGYDGKGAYEFDGSTTVIDTVFLGISNEASYSIAMWVNGASGQSDKRIFSEGSVADGSPLFNLGTDSGASNAKLDIYIRDDDDEERMDHVQSTSDVFDGSWHHVVWVDSGGSYQVYVDGNSDISGSYTKNAKTLDTTTIGAIRRASVSHFFDGSIDEVMIYDRSLSADQVQVLFENRTDLIVSQETDVDDVWTCEVTPNDGTADGIADNSSDLTVLAGAPDPSINEITCYESGAWKDCTTLGFGETFESVRANCTSNSGGSITNVTVWMKNIDDDKLYFNSTVTSMTSGFWEYDFVDFDIEDSGNFNLHVICRENPENETDVNWSIAYGTLSAQLISPSSDINITQNRFFNFTSQVTCTGGECGYVNATLDPIAPVLDDDFDGDDISGYGETGGNWDTSAYSGRGYVLTLTDNGDHVFYNSSESFTGTYTVKGIMMNGDNDATGLAFRVNTADADNFYSCSATSDGGFDAGVWRHTNDVADTPTSNLAGTTWDYVEDRWYNITITVDEGANTINCVWESSEAGVELNVTATDDDVRESGSVGFWVSSQNDFYADLLYVEQNTNKSVVPMNSGTPFYTTTQNPANSSTFACLANMGGGDSCTTTWAVNATGYADVTWPFFVTYEAFNYSANVSAINTSIVNLTIIANAAPTVGTVSITPAIPGLNSDLNCTFTVSDSSHLDSLTANVTWYADDIESYSVIVDVSNGATKTHTLDSGNTSADEDWHCGVTPSDHALTGSQVNSSSVNILASIPPVANQPQCKEVGSGWAACSNVVFGDVLDAVRVDCSDSDGYIVNATFNFSNLDDSKTFFYNTTTDNDTGYFVFNNSDLTIEDSGTFNLSVVCTDNSTASATNNTDWSLAWGTLSGSLVSPSSAINVTQNAFFNFVSRVTCSGGECGYVNATLDPMVTVLEDDFDGDDISGYSDTGGNWDTDTYAGRGYVVTLTDNGDNVFYNDSADFEDTYTVRGTIMNGDNDATGLAFRVNTADADDFYSCSATSDGDFDAGVWRHTNDLDGTPTSNLAGTTWDYVEDRWYNITITIDEDANTINCVWESSESGVELNVTATDDDVRESGSVGFWVSSQDEFHADFLQVKESQSKGVVPMNSGTPFYTTTQNPADSATFACLADMGAGDSCSTTWSVNATGDTGITWPFFVTYEAFNYSANVSSVNTPQVNITIIANVAPTVDSVSIVPAFPAYSSDLNCTFTISDASSLDVLTANVSWYKDGVFVLSEVVSVYSGVSKIHTLDSGNTTENDVWHCGVTPSDHVLTGSQVNSSNVTILGTLPPVVQEPECMEAGSGWAACSNVVFGDTLDAVRVNCSDPDGSVVNATFNLSNIEDSYTFFSNTTTDNSTGYFVFNNTDITIADSGTFNLTVTCTDNNNTPGYNHSQWTIPWGTLSSVLSSPVTNINVTHNIFFNFVSEVTCTGGECGYVNATLDPPANLLYDDFDGDDISGYGETGGDWDTAAYGGRGYVVTYTDNDDDVFYNSTESFTGTYTVKGIIMNGDNDATGLAFRVNTADADNFYSCSATSDGGFDAGVWRHTNDLAGTPTSNLAGTSWDYVEGRWYTITINIDETANTINCIWESTEGGVELNVTATDDDVRESGSVGFWVSSQDDFYGDLLQVQKSKGVVPMDSGSPFYTTTQNPANSSTFACLANMSDGDACSTTWAVNATGDTGSTWPFFVIYGAMNYSTDVNDSNTSIVNLTIIANVAPVVSEVTLTPLFPVPADDLYCNFTITDASALDSLTANVSWYLNGVYNQSSVVAVTSGVEKSVILDSGNTTLDEVWHCGVTPSDHALTGTQVNSSNVTIGSSAPPVINEVQCYRNNTDWVDCTLLAFNEVFSGVRVNCTSATQAVANVTFNFTNIPDSNLIFDNTTTTNSSDWWEFYINTTMNNSGEYELYATCNDNNSRTDSELVNWSLPWGTLVGTLIDPADNTNVQQYAFFNFISQISCVGGECGDVNATLDPYTTIMSDDFDGDDISAYGNFGGGDWDTAAYSGRGYVVTETDDGDSVLYNTTADFNSSYNYKVLGTLMNSDNDAVGLAFRVNTADADDFYSCSATSDNDFNAGIWRHDDDVDADPTSSLGSVPWNFVSNRWYDITITINEDANTINCIWESSAGGVELNVTATDDDVRESGSVGFWVSSQDGFYADLLEVQKSKGVVPMNSGNPFYTTTQNPADSATFACLDNMIAGDSCNTTWVVNATGTINTTWEFFVDYNMTSNQAYVDDVQTDHVNLTISDAALVPPTVTLESPADTTYTNDSSVVFNCSATDNSGLENMTLFGDFNGSWASNGTNSISGTSDSTNFTRTLADGEYVWNCKAFDTDDNYDWGLSNYTLTIDTVEPNINLSAPDPADSFSVSSITFNFTVTDSLDSSLTCNLTINGTVEDANFAAANNTLISKTIDDLVQGMHFWNVTCWDDAGNTNTSETRNFTISDIPPTVELITQDEVYQQSTTIVLEYNASDNNNVTQARLYINGVLDDTDSSVANGEVQNFTVTDLPEGRYNWTVNVTDLSGLTAQAAEKWFTIDHTGPNINLSDPEDDFSTNLSTLDFNFTVTDNLDDPLDCNITLNGIVVDTGFTAANGSLKSRSISDLPDGINYWNVTCWDDAGNMNTSETWMLNISAPPTVVLNYPPDNHSQSSVDLTLNYTPTDNSGFTGCDLILNGVFNQSNSSPITNGAVNSFDLEDLLEANYNWTVNCTDTSGLNTVASPVLTFIIDGTGPNIALHNPTPDQTIYDETVTFNFTATDAVDDVMTCNLTIDGVVNLTNIDAPNGSWVNRSVTLASDGQHNWSVTCWDDAGNSNTSETRNFTTINPPDVALESPDIDAILNYSINVNFSYTPEDSDGLNFTELIINGSVNDTDPSPENDEINFFLVNFSEDGVYTWTVNATDNLGLEATATPRNVTIDTTRPNVTLNHPDTDEILTWNNVTLNFTASDNLDNELVCDIHIDGTIEFASIDVTSGDTIIRYKELNDGDYNWSVNCTDHANWTNIYEIKNFTVLAPPNVTLNYPINSQRTSDLDITFNYTPEDFIGFENCSLYIDGVFNQSDDDVEENEPNYFGPVTFVEGTYNWTVRCIDGAPDLNSFTAIVENFTIDTTGPSIVLNAPNESQIMSGNDVTFNWTPTDADGINITCNLTIDEVVNVTNIINLSGEDFTQEVLDLADGDHNWSVTCWDDLNNSDTSETRNFTINQPDLTITSANITFNNSSPEEGDNMTIYANVFNIGGIPADNFTVQFWNGDPDSGGTQISVNQTVATLSNGDNVTLSVTHILDIGTYNIFVIVDPPLATNGVISELNESNNKANNSFAVSLFHVAAGNATDLLRITNNLTRILFQWDILNITGSNLFVTDSDSTVSWDDLEAIGRDTSQVATSDDFEQIDAAFSSTALSDSINTTYTTGGAPITTQIFTVFADVINNVPVANSTNTSSFITGILWDTADGGAEYSGTQDLIFVTKMNQSKQGQYGTYDFEISIPAPLREYTGGGSTVDFYAEIK